MSDAYIRLRSGYTTLIDIEPKPSWYREYPIGDQPGTVHGYSHGSEKFPWEGYRPEPYGQLFTAAKALSCELATAGFGSDKLGPEPDYHRRIGKASPQRLAQ